MDGSAAAGVVGGHRAFGGQVFSLGLLRVLCGFLGLFFSMSFPRVF